MENLPCFNPVRNSPETKDSAIVLTAFHKVRKTSPLIRWKRSAAPPFKVIGPFITDQRNKIRSSLTTEVSGSSVEGTIAGGIFFNKGPRSGSAQNCGDRARAMFSMQDGGKHGAVTGEKTVQNGIRLIPIGLDINKKNKSFLTREYNALVSLYLSGKGLQVHLLQGATLPNSEARVGDMKLLATKKNIYLDTAESPVESIKKWAFMKVIVVGVGTKQRKWIFLQRSCLFPP